MAGVKLSAERLQAQELRMETPNQAECDHLMIEILRDTQAAWSLNHPAPQLLVGKVFPTTRRDCLKIPYGMLEKTDAIVSPEYQAALRAVLDGRFPEVIQLAISHLFLNYFSPNEQLIRSQGRHLFMLKSYDLRKQIHCWFIPLAEVEKLQAASSENLKQGISYNDLALVQTYCLAGVLALHAETWGAGARGNSQQSRGGYGECNWIGGTAFHYGWDEREEASNFATMGMDLMPELAQKKAKEREKRARKRAKQKQKKAEAKEEELRQQKQQEEEAEAERRKHLMPVNESLAAALKSMTFANQAKPQPSNKTLQVGDDDMDDGDLEEDSDECEECK